MNKLKMFFWKWRLSIQLERYHKAKACYYFGYIEEKYFPMLDAREKHNKIVRRLVLEYGCDKKEIRRI